MAMREAISSFFIFWSMWSKRAPMSLQQKHQRKDINKKKECPHLTESSRLNTSSKAQYRFPYPVLPRTLGYITAQPSSFSK